MTKVDGVVTGRLHISDSLFCEEFPDMVCLAQGACNGVAYGVLKEEQYSYSLLDQITFIWNKKTGYTIYYFQYNFPQNQKPSLHHLEFCMQDKGYVEEVLDREYQANIYHLDIESQVFLTLVQWNSQSSAGQGVFIQNQKPSYKGLVTGINIPERLFGMC